MNASQHSCSNCWYHCHHHCHHHRCHHDCCHHHHRHRHHHRHLFLLLWGIMIYHNFPPSWPLLLLELACIVACCKLPFVRKVLYYRKELSVHRDGNKYRFCHIIFCRHSFVQEVKKYIMHVLADAQEVKDLFFWRISRDLVFYVISVFCIPGLCQVDRKHRRGHIKGTWFPIMSHFFPTFSI